MPGKKKSEAGKVIENVEEAIEKTARKAEKAVKEAAEDVEEKVEEIVENLGLEDKETGGKAKKKTGKKKVEEEKVDELKERKITKEELEKKAKKLAEKIKTEGLKEKLEKEREKDKEKKKTLILIEDYVKAGIHVGTKVITPHMRRFVYRRRNDGIAIINTNIIDERLKEMIELVSKYAPEDFIVVCKREAGWKAVKKFSELTGVRIFTKKYPAGILTNIKLPNFFETEMIFICDPWLDKNALRDAKKMKKPIYALCDTNNYTFDIDFFVPCNNKSIKSLGIVFYILTREYLKARKIKKDVKMEDFVELE